MALCDEVWKVTNQQGYHYHSRLVLAKNNKEAKENAINDINVYIGNAPVVRDIRWEYKEGDKLVANKALPTGERLGNSLKTFCKSMEKVHNQAINDYAYLTRSHWINCGYGVPKELEICTAEYEEGWNFIGPLELTWESNPSFSESAYQAHFGFPSQPGYYEVEYGKEEG